MADEIEAGGAGPRIQSSDDFAKWLEEARPAPDVCVALAARAALRALPLILWDQLGYPVQRADAKKKEILRHFQSMIASLFTAKYPGSVANFSDDIFPFGHVIWDVVPPLNEFCALHVMKAVVSAESAASDLYESLFSHPFSPDTKIHQPTIEAVDCASASINYAATNSHRIIDENKVSPDDRVSNLFEFRAKIIRPEDLDAEAKRAESDYWDAIQQDFRLVLSGVQANALAEKPLWHGKPPILITNYWRPLKDFLPDSDNWQVWKNWYEDILKGTAHSEAHDMIYATVPVEEWDKGPAAANTWIAAKLAELEKNTPDSFTDSFEKLTQQDPHGASFEIVEGKARIAESLNENDAKVAGDPQTIQLHERVKIRANNARERVQRLANQPGFERIAATVEEYYNYISDDTLSVAANISTVWELSVAIGSFIERDDEIRAGRGGMVSEMEPDARETLDQLIIASAPFVRRFPTARQNDDDVRLFKQSREIFNPAKKILEQAIIENLIEDSSKAPLIAALHSAEISSGIQYEKNLFWVTNSTRNLIRSLLNFVLVSGIGISIFASTTFTGKAIEDFYDHSQSRPMIREFLLEKENDIINLFSNFPSDLRATIRETYRRLKKIHLPS